MSRGISQWQAGALAMWTIARWIVDGGDAAKMREFVQWLEPADVATDGDQIGIVFILDAIQELAKAGGELSLKRLQARLAGEGQVENDLRSILRNIVDHRDHGPSPDGGADFDELVASLKEFREARARKALEARREAVGVARSILNHTTGVIDGAKQLEWVVDEFQPEEHPTFAVFARVAHEVLGYPEESQRTFWSRHALAQQDLHCAQLERDAWPDVEKACRELVQRWGAV